jgi:hypothetical protein
MEIRLKPQDVVLALKLASSRAADWAQPAVARILHMSAAEVNHGLKRLVACHDDRVVWAGSSGAGV